MAKKGNIPWNKGLKNTSSKKWNDKELKILNDNYYDMGAVNLSGNLLENRSIQNIRTKAFKLGLKVSKETHCKNMSIARLKRKEKLGYVNSLEARRKISIKSSGENNGMYGKTRTKEVKEKISEKMSGENNPRWLGGIARLPYPFEFNKQLKEKIKQRDNFTCQLCGDFIPKNISSKERLVIHHIDYNKKNSSEDNLITLCNLCNVSVNTKRNEWTKQFKEKIEEIGNGNIQKME